MATCLLLKTKDKRKFLTHKKNLPMLTEYVNTFGAEVSLVQIDPSYKPQVLELKSLAPALCDANYADEPKYQLIERILPRPQRSRRDILKNAARIQDSIKKSFLSGKPVALKELKTKHAKEQLTDACLCNHLSQVRRQLLAEGYSVVKLGAGTYQLVDAPGN